MNDDEKLFTAKINDLFNISEQKNIARFSSFLNEKEQYAAGNIARSRNRSFMFYGGHENAVRKILGVFPEYIEPDESCFPIVPATFVFKKEYSLSHRDFLGSLMALGIKREAVGDILTAEGRAAVFLLDTVAKSALTELLQVGRVGVKSSEGYDGEICARKEFEEQSGTVASARLDSVIAFITGLSRERAAGLIKCGQVCVNYRESESVSRNLDDGDIVTVRGYGKYIFCSDNSVTKKGRLRIVCKKYI